MATYNLNFPSLSNQSKEQNEKYFIELEELEIGTCLRGVVTHVDDPLTFYIQFENQKKHLFLEILSVMQTVFDRMKTTSSLNLRPGCCYAVKLKDMWCRALLEEVSQDNQCSIFLFDAGSRQLVNSSLLQFLPDCFLTVPPQASCCKLASVIPSNELSPDILSRHTIISKTIMENCIVTVFIESFFVGQVGRLNQGESTLYVTAYAGNDLYSINKQLTFGGYFRSIKEHEQPWHQEVRSTLGPSIIKIESKSDNFFKATPNVPSRAHETSGNAHQKFPSVSTTTAPPARLPAVEVPTCITGSFGTEYSSFGSMPTANNYVIPVKFLVCLLPSVIFLRPVSYIKIFLHMQEQLQKTYCNFQVKERGRFDIGTWCAALVEGQWIRAVILDYDENLFCSVFCIDFGLSCRVSISNVLPLIEPYLSVPKLALKCSLARVDPSDASIVVKISKILIGAKDIYISSAHRPKVMPSIMSVDVIYRLSDGKLVNLNDQLVVEKIIQSSHPPINFVK